VKVVGTTTSTVYEKLGAAANFDGAWTTQSVNISSFAGQTVRIRIRIEAADASTASLVEAGVDDVKVVQQS
jgi:aminopeptidase S